MIDLVLPLFYPLEDQWKDFRSLRRWTRLYQGFHPTPSQRRVPSSTSVPQHNSLFFVCKRIKFIQQKYKRFLN